MTRQRREYPKLVPCRIATRDREGREALRAFLRHHADGIPEHDIIQSTRPRSMHQWTLRCDGRGRIAAVMRFAHNDWFLCTLKNAAVRKSLRGRGYGRELYQATAKRALAERTRDGYPACHVLAADVTYDNKASIKALQRAGFRPVNRFCWGKGEKPADILHYVRVSPRGTACK